jgi:hypothetical protein
MQGGDPMNAGTPGISDGAVRAYLARLAAELEGCDAALRHDALLDAEAHLAAAVRDGTAPDRAIAEYGDAAEIARAYRDEAEAPRAWRDAPLRGSDSPTPDATAPVVPAGAGTPRRGLRRLPVIGIWFDPHAWGALAYFGAVGFALSVAYFTWSISLGALSLGLMPVVVGLPLFVLLLGSARALCLFEGKVVELFLGVRMPRRVQPVAGVEEVGFWQRIWCWLRDVRSWMSLGYLLGNFPVSIVLFALTITIAMTSAVLLALPVLGAIGIPVGHVEWGDDVAPSIEFLGSPLQPDANGDIWMTVPLAIVSIALGLALATAGLWLMRGLGWIYGHVVQAIQVARPRPSVPPRAHR